MSEIRLDDLRGPAQLAERLTKEGRQVSIEVIPTGMRVAAITGNKGVAIDLTWAELSQAPETLLNAVYAVGTARKAQG